jgi:hypothetical protein
LAVSCADAGAAPRRIDSSTVPIRTAGFFTYAFLDRRPRSITTTV